MTYNGLFQIPDGPEQKPVRATGQEVRRAEMPVRRVGAGRVGMGHTGVGRIERDRPEGLSEGLEPSQEFSTGMDMRPVRADDPMLLPESHGGRLKLAAMLAFAAILVVSAVAGVIAFAAGR